MVIGLGAWCDYVTEDQYRDRLLSLPPAPVPSSDGKPRPGRWSPLNRDMAEEALENFRRGLSFRVQEFADLWPNTAEGKGLLLMGGCGAGKTHLAVAALMEVINSGKAGRVLFTNFQDLIQEIHASFDHLLLVESLDLGRRFDDIAQCGSVREQAKALENHPHLLAAKLDQL